MSRLTFDLLCFSLCKMQRRRKSSILPQVFCASGQIILAFSLKNAISSLIICPFGNYLSQFLFSFVISCLGFYLPFWILFSQSLRLCLLYSFTEIIFMSSQRFFSLLTKNEYLRLIKVWEFFQEDSLWLRIQAESVQHRSLHPK